MNDIIERRRANLLKLIRDRYDGSQTNFSVSTGIKLSQIGQWLDVSGENARNMSERSARKIESKASLSEGWMDAPHGGGTSFRALQSKSADQSVFAQLDVQAICGNGRPAPDHPEVVSMMTMPVGMAQSLLGTTNRLGLVKIVSAANDSMAPTIEPDDLLFVDTSVVEYTTEGVYLLVHDSGLICKRLSRPGKDIIVSSDNPFYKSWKWNERPEQTRIVGRVLRALPIQFKKFSGD